MDFVSIFYYPFTKPPLNCIIYTTPFRTISYPGMIRTCEQLPAPTLAGPTEEFSMNIKAAVASLQAGKKKVEPIRLLTPWGERLDPDMVLPEYPRPQLSRASYINLNGWWEAAFTKGDIPRTYPEKILVPFSPESLLSGVDHSLAPEEVLWYRRSIPVDNIPSGKRLLLHFGAVDQSAVVFLNAREVTSHEGGYLAFTADLTPYLRQGENELIVRVTDPSDTGSGGRGKQMLKPGGMFYTATSGIWQTVWLEWVPEVYVRDLKITPDIDRDRLLLKVFAEGAAAPLPYDLRIPEYGVSAKGVTGKTLDVPIPNARLWSPEDPHLTPFTVVLGEDVVISYFAMRKFSVGRDESGEPRLMLNNKPYFMHGVLDQGYWSDGMYTAPSDEALIHDIREMKALGFNTLRKHLKVEPMRWYYHCDRLGMIVWQDMVNGGGAFNKLYLTYMPTVIPAMTTRMGDHNYGLYARTDPEGRRRWIRETRGTIRQLYNVPSIGLWTAFNEGWGQFDAAKNVAKMKALDPTRPIDEASGWFDQGSGDIRSVHNYFRKLIVEHTHRPFCITEYGGLTLPVEGHLYSTEAYSYEMVADRATLRNRFRALMEEILGLEAEGLSGAIYTQLSDVEEEVNGILTFDRRVNKLKDD